MTTDRPIVRLLPRHDQRLRAGSSWIFSNEINVGAETKALERGAVVRVETAEGKPMGAATLNLHALIAGRIFDRDAGAKLDQPWFEHRLRTALRLRERFFTKPLYRLVHAEGDGLPGFICDRYGDVCVVQANTAGAEKLLPTFLAALNSTVGPEAVVLRNDGSGRALEGLPSAVSVAKGEITGPVEIEDRGVRFALDPVGGQKTGWYLDIAEARGRVARLAQGVRVLDLYCHTGAFGLIAAKAGAAGVVAVDSSQPALDLAAATAARNGLDGRWQARRGDVFPLLEQDAIADRFDIVVADPPSFVKSKKDLGGGLRAYRKLARLAAGRVVPRGFLFIASCSHNVTVDAFATEVAAGLNAADRGGRIVMSGGAGPDHPIHPQLPETAYLKWLLLQLD